MQEALSHLTNADPVLGGIIQKVGPYSIEHRDPDFDTLARSIIFQQLSGNVARVILGRLRDAVPGGLITAEAVLKLRIPRMRKMGLSAAKTEYIRALARHTRDGTVKFTDLPGVDDDAVIATLTKVKGIGVWTAQMFLMFALKRTDVLPVGDLGVRKAMQMAYRLPEMPNPATMMEIAEPWRPYRSVASWYLWRSLDGIAAL